MLKYLVKNNVNEIIRLSMFDKQGEIMPPSCLVWNMDQNEVPSEYYFSIFNVSFFDKYVCHAVMLAS